MSWEMVKLDDICDIITCGVAARPEYVDDGIPFLSSLNVKENRFILNSFKKIKPDDHKKLNKYSNPVEGDILYTRVGSFGEAAVIDFDFDFSIFVSLTLIKPKRNIIESRFLMWYLNSPTVRFFAKNNTSGVGVQNLNVSVVRKYQIPLPPLSTQKRIAEILDKADALRKKDQQLLKYYDDLAQSLFIDLFGDPVKNEKGWEVKKLGELGNWKSGGTPTRSNPEFFKGNIPWLSSGELNDIFISKSTESITEQAIQNSSTSLIPINSLLLGMYDTAALKSSINKVILSCNQAIAFSHLDKKNSNVIFVYYLIKIGKEEFKKAQRGVRQKNLNLSLIKDIKTIHPPIDFQNQFAIQIQNIEQQKERLKIQLQASEHLFQALLKQAFNGGLN